MFFTFYPHIVLVDGSRKSLIIDFQSKKSYSISINLYFFLRKNTNENGIIELETEDINLPILKTFAQKEFGLFSSFKLNFTQFKHEPSDLIKRKLTIQISSSNIYLLQKDSLYYRKLQITSIDIIWTENILFKTVMKALSNLDNVLLTSIRLLIDSKKISYKISRVKKLYSNYSVVESIIVFNSADSYERDNIRYTTYTLDEIYSINKINHKNIFINYENYVMSKNYNVTLANSIHIDAGCRVYNFIGHSLVLGIVSMTSLFEIVTSALYNKTIARTKDSVLGCKECVNRNICLDPSELRLSSIDFIRLSSCIYNM